MAEFATKGVGAAGLTTGIIGSALGVLNGGLGMIGGFGNGGYGGYGGYGNGMFYNAYLSEKDAEIAELKSERYADNAVLDLYKYVDRELKDIREKAGERWTAQYVANSQISSAVALNTNQIEQLMRLTRLRIPNSVICPGWGDVTVTPTPATDAAAAG